jgi:hypothetical protein
MQAVCATCRVSVVKEPWEKGYAYKLQHGIMVYNSVLQGLTWFVAGFDIFVAGFHDYMLAYIIYVCMVVTYG